MTHAWLINGALAVVLALAALEAFAGKDQAAAICQLCGMDAAKSETEFVLQPKSEPAMHACCINCARRLIKKLGADVTTVTALDFSTRKQVAAEDAFYVFGSSRIPKGSMTPFVFAFLARDDADTFRRRNGGEVLSFKEALLRLETGKSAKEKPGR